jgi:L-ribulose-5-phosphate 3-epimerase
MGPLKNAGARMISRRSLIALAVAPLARSATRLPIKKAVEFEMLPQSIPVLEQFQLARDCGFEEIECPTTPDVAKAEEMLAASKRAGLRIHSVMNQEHWRSPLSSPDPVVVEKSLEGMRTSLHNAKLWGADTVLLVPAVVTPDTGYAQAWKRSQRQIRKLIPLASQLGIIIGIE